MTRVFTRGRRIPRPRRTPRRLLARCRLPATLYAAAPPPIIPGRPFRASVAPPLSAARRGARLSRLCRSDLNAVVFAEHDILVLPKPKLRPILTLWLPSPSAVIDLWTWNTWGILKSACRLQFSHDTSSPLPFATLNSAPVLASTKAKDSLSQKDTSAEKWVPRARYVSYKSCDNNAFTLRIIYLLEIIIKDVQ